MKVLIIAPHADDEVLGVGGTIQWHNHKGHEVYVCVVTNRVIDHKIDKDYFLETKKNAENAKSILGIKKYLYCNLKDEHLDESLIEVIMPIEKIINEVRPDIVYIPNESDTNQDHRAVFWACRVACRKIDKLIIYEVPSSTPSFNANLYVKLSEEFMQNKIKAMDCYESEVRPYPNPRSGEGLVTLAKMRGMESNQKMAEAFILFREVLE